MKIKLVKSIQFCPYCDELIEIRLHKIEDKSEQITMKKTKNGTLITAPTSWGRIKFYARGKKKESLKGRREAR